MLTDDNASFRRDVYEFKLLGFEIRMKIPVVKILDYKLNKELKEKLETSTNPMTMIVRAQLKSLEVKKADFKTKFEVTKELIRECYRQGYSRDDTRIIMHFFGWAIRLPASLKNRIRNEIKKVEEDLKMEYIPLWERDSHEEGIKIGVKEGMEEGEKKKAMESLHRASLFVEESFNPRAHFRELIRKERSESDRYGGRTVFDGKSRKSVKKRPIDEQLSLF